MNTYTVHLRPGSLRPVLVREGFSMGAALFGPLWLAARRAWIAAGLLFALWLVLCAVPAGGMEAAMAGVLMLWQGFAGRDLRRWNLERQGYVTAHVLLGRDEPAAWARLFAIRPDLVTRAAA